MKVIYRGMTIIPRKALRGYDCKVYNGLLVPREGAKRGYKPKRMRDVWVPSLERFAIEKTIDDTFFGGDRKDQTRVEDFK